MDNSFAFSGTDEQKIASYENVAIVSPRLESFALVSSSDITKGSLVIGIDPKNEDKITLLRNKIMEGNYLESNDKAILLSQGLAARLKVKLKDTITLLGQGYHGATAASKYPVKGIIRFGSPELNDKVLFMPITAAQDFFSADGILTSYVLALNKVEDMQLTAAGIRSAIGPGYEVMTWEEMIPDIKQHIETDSNNMKYVQGVLYLLICFGIFGTLLMMMIERKFEMGMLVAIGMKKTKLVILLLYESMFTVLTGCLLGIAASIPIIYYLNNYPFRIGGEAAKAYERFGFEAIFPTSVDIKIFFYQGITVLIIGLILSLYPVFKVIRLNPLAAMKH